jgi:hypothetical protein
MITAESTQDNRRFGRRPESQLDGRLPAKRHILMLSG